MAHRRVLNNFGTTESNPEYFQKRLFRTGAVLSEPISASKIVVLKHV